MSKIWMKLDELSAYIKISRSKLYNMVQRGEIPASKIGNQWRFDREEVDLWMKNKESCGADLYNTDRVINKAVKATNVGSQYFIDILRSNASPLAKWHSIKSLGELACCGAIHELVNVLMESDVEFDKSSLHRISAWALGCIGEPAATAIMGKYTQNISKSSKIALIDSLGEVGSPVAMHVLSEAFQEEDFDVKLWAALSMGKIGEPSIEKLVEFSGNASSEELFLILDALVMIASEKTIAGICSIINDHPSVAATYFSQGNKGRIADFLQKMEELGSVGRKMTRIVNNLEG